MRKYERTDRHANQSLISRLFGTPGTLCREEIESKPLALRTPEEILYLDLFDYGKEYPYALNLAWEALKAGREETLGERRRVAA